MSPALAFAQGPPAAARYAGGLTSPSHLAGTASIRVALSQGHSRVTRAYATSPLRLLTPDNHGSAAWIFMSSYGGGLVGGDALLVDVAVDAGAAAFVSTQASTKVYRSPLGTESRLDARVGPGGVLVLLPDPVVCFASSRYRQQQHFDVAADAGLVVADWMTSGRREAGERWLFDEYVSRIGVSIDGCRVVYDSVTLRQSDGDLAAELGRFNVLATVVVVGAPFAARAAAMHARLAARPLNRRGDLLISASVLAPRLLGDVGCLVRIAGLSVEQVAGQLRDSLGFVPEMLGDDPWQRKW